MHEEAYRVFYGHNTLRLFNVHGRFFHTKWQLMARLPKRYRAAVSALELRLGPGWTAPPKSWVVNDRLGIQDCTELRVLKIFIECDPASDEIFKGFRVAGDFYTKFSLNLVKEIFAQVPSINEVQFDGYPSVAKNSPLLETLVTYSRGDGKVISWGSLEGYASYSVMGLSKALAHLKLHNDTGSVRSVFESPSPLQSPSEGVRAEA